MPVLVLLTGAPLDEGVPVAEPEPPGAGGPIGPIRRRREPMIDLELWEYSLRKEEEEYLLIH